MNDPESLFFPETAARRPLLIAGPCSAETEEQLLTTARALAAAGYTVCNRLAKGEWVCLAAKLAA